MTTPLPLPAMSYPASGVESTYRNNLKDVAKMLRTKHQESYMVSRWCCVQSAGHLLFLQIFNLSERSYDISKFNNQVLDFGWPDHLAPSLERLSRCEQRLRAHTQGLFHPSSSAVCASR